MQGFQYQDRGQTPVDTWTDIRNDDEYENFYNASTAAGRRLPPPLDAGAMYNHLPHQLQQPTIQQQLLAARASPNHAGMSLLPFMPPLLLRNLISELCSTSEKLDTCFMDSSII